MHAAMRIGGCKDVHYLHVHVLHIKISINMYRITEKHTLELIIVGSVQWLLPKQQIPVKTDSWLQDEIKFLHCPRRPRHHRRPRRPRRPRHHRSLHTRHAKPLKSTASLVVRLSSGVKPSTSA